MAAPKNNQFWKARAKHGRDLIFSTPELLWDACCEYFEWCDDNPLMSSVPVTFQGGAHNHDVPKLRAYTKEGLYIFLDIDRKTWDLYKDRKDFIPIITRVEDIIYNQKFTGAAGDLLNQNIIARDLGLVDRSDMTTKDKPIKSDLDLTDLSDDELAVLAKAVRNKKNETQSR